MPPSRHPRLERGRVRDLHLREVLLVLARPDVEAGAGDEAAVLDRVDVRMAERAELVVLLEVGEVELRDPFDRAPRQLARLLQARNERLQIRPTRCLVEAADADVDRVDRPAADRPQEVVAGRLDLQAALDHLAVVAGHRPGRLEAEEVGGVQQEDVEGVRLDPLTAIHQPPQGPDRLRDVDFERVLHRVEGAGHVGDRTDAADPGRDIRCLGERAAAQESLEEAGWLVDLQLDVFDVAVADPNLHRTLALDPGQGLGADRPGLAVIRHRRPACRSPP